MKRISKNIKETKSIAIEFLVKLIPTKNQATVVGLYGDLGAGKTTFTQTAGKYFGIKRKVNSPTFVIMKRYSLKHKNFDQFFHLDAYRLKSEIDVKNIGWGDIISNERNLVFIEWPEQIKKAMPKKHHEIHITHLKENGREFKIKKV